MNDSNPYVCDECGEARVRICSGLVCPNGHGRIWIHPNPVAYKRRLFLAWREKLPVAVRVKPWPENKRVAFRIGGDDPRLWNYVCGYTPCTPETVLESGAVVAKVRAGGAWLVRQFVLVPEKKGEHDESREHDSSANK